MRKALALTLITASLVAGGSAYARQAGNDGFNVMNPATPDPEAVMGNQLNGALPQGGQFGSVRIQSGIQSDTTSRNAPGAPDHAWGQENALNGA